MDVADEVTIMVRGAEIGDVAAVVVEEAEAGEDEVPECDGNIPKLVIGFTLMPFWHLQNPQRAKHLKSHEWC